MNVVLFSLGDLAEAALYQLGQTKGKSVHVGAEGNWNSTLEPKWYFVKNGQFLQVTDAEIRGGLDGLYLAFSINDIKKTFQDIKLSQILDLYYSPRGVFNSSLRACNRKTLETSFITSEKLIEQTAFFETLLDPVATLDSSIDPNEFKELAGLAVDSFNKYIRKKNSSILNTKLFFNSNRINPQDRIPYLCIIFLKSEAIVLMSSTIFIPKVPKYSFHWIFWNGSPCLFHNIK